MLDGCRYHGGGEKVAYVSDIKDGRAIETLSLTGESKELSVRRELDGKEATAGEDQDGPGGRG